MPNQNDRAIRGGATGLTVALAYPPSANRLWRNHRGRMVVSSEAQAWKRAAAWKARAQGCPLLVGPVAVSVILHPRLTKSGKESQIRLDVDGPIKITLDALQGVAYDNDRQVVRLSAMIGPPLQEGGLTVDVWPADLEGISSHSSEYARL